MIFTFTLFREFLFASDLNPVAVILNKVQLEYIPKYGKRLADEVRKWGRWVKEQAEAELSQFYPKDADGATPIAYLWARTITCEGPACGATIPLIKSLTLAKKPGRSVTYQMVANLAEKAVDLSISHSTKAPTVSEGTVRRSAVICPVCGYTTPAASVRRQLKERHGGASDARLLAVVTAKQGQQGRHYRLPMSQDLDAVLNAVKELEHRTKIHREKLSLIPQESTPLGGGSGAGRAFSQRNYGMDRFEDVFTARQALTLSILARLVNDVGKQRLEIDSDTGFAIALQTCLALIVDRQANTLTSLSRWHTG